MFELSLSCKPHINHITMSPNRPSECHAFYTLKPFRQESQYRVDKTLLIIRVTYHTESQAEGVCRDEDQAEEYLSG